ncbi:MAG: hypothetical protein KUG81_06415 [Gammaproteobacteria bacterium]|nr:hypothetical protein [Gammaproteobacteria bacterium]
MRTLLLTMALLAFNIFGPIGARAQEGSEPAPESQPPSSDTDENTSGIFIDSDGLVGIGHEPFPPDKLYVDGMSTFTGGMFLRRDLYVSRETSMNTAVVRGELSVEGGISKHHEDGTKSNIFGNRSPIASAATNGDQCSYDINPESDDTKKVPPDLCLNAGSKYFEPEPLSNANFSCVVVPNGNGWTVTANSSPGIRLSCYVMCLNFKDVPLKHSPLNLVAHSANGTSCMSKNLESEL